MNMRRKKQTWRRWNGKRGNKGCHPPVIAECYLLSDPGKHQRGETESSRSETRATTATEIAERRRPDFNLGKRELLGLGKWGVFCSSRGICLGGTSHHNCTQDLINILVLSLEKQSLFPAQNCPGRQHKLCPSQALHAREPDIFANLFLYFPHCQHQHYPV